MLSAQDVVKLYQNEIQEISSKKNIKIYQDSIYEIDLILELFDLEFDWKNPVQSFEDFVSERIENKIAQEKLLYAYKCIQNYEKYNNELIDLIKSINEQDYSPSKREKILVLEKLADIPGNCGEQFINVKVNLGKEYGDIYFGFNWKSQMGEYQFNSFDEAIDKVIELRKLANLNE